MNTKSSLYLVQDDNGELLADGAILACARRADDQCIWTRQGNQLVSAGGHWTLDVAMGEDSEELRVTGAPEGIDAARLTVLAGPGQLPSVHLAELRAQGFTVLESVVSASACAAIKAAASLRIPSDAEQYDARVGIADSLGWSPEVARCATHPVALWLIEQYLESPDIHYGHAPSVTVLRPAKDLLGTHPEMGWHSDYPYHPGVLEDGRWQDDHPLGVQFNICIDEFRSDNAATQFLPGSHTHRQWPPEAFNEGGTRMGEGVHREVSQLTAPAGAALIYDSRMWHRACEELNVSGEDRYAVLNAVTLAWVRPMVDKSPSLAAYEAGPVPALITSREQADIRRLCHTNTLPAPEGAPVISKREY